MESSLGIQLNEGVDQDRISALLLEKYSFEVEEPISEEWVFYDTFDWRLYRKSLLLYLSGSTLTLRRMADGEPLDSLVCERWSSFADGLQDSALKRKLQKLIGIRALLILARVHARASVYRILNREQKTVSRLVYVEAGQPPLGDEAQPLTTYLSLQPVRGYPRYASQLAADLEPLGMGTSIWEQIYRNALKAARIRPGAYSSGLGLHLDPGQRADEATRLILRRLLEVMVTNEAGVRADIDTEFLHDYRIAVRKTRAALSQLGDVLPAPVVDRFKKDFASLGKISNQLRDLDVYLLAENRYRDMLPEAMREDITPLFMTMRRLRKGALTNVIQGLDSDEYAAVLGDWKAFLDSPGDDTSPERIAAQPVVELARERIFKRYRKIVKEGFSILENTQDERLHALRIECKKLRYLIEFFGSLFPPKKIKRLIRQLRMLQDNLGEFNDLTVQQEYILSIAGQLPVENPATRRALIATGYLVDNLAHRRLVVKGEFAETFTGFTVPKNQKLYYELFKQKQGKTS